MSGSNGDWSALASDNERLVLTAADSELTPATSRTPDLAPARWAELASQRERLVDTGDSFGGLASSHLQTSELRLAVRVA
jgi:hypothetical protein